MEELKDSNNPDKANNEQPDIHSLLERFGAFDPKLDLQGYKYPPLDLLSTGDLNQQPVKAEELEAQKRLIVETLNYQQIKIEKISAIVGPTVTHYEIIPKPGTRVARIKSMEDDLALSLGRAGVHILGPIPGKGSVGIEVPHLHPETVRLRSVLATLAFQQTEMELPVVLGKTMDNQVYIADLAQMPHLLISGATGQGKSVFIHSLLASLLYKKHPAELKFILIDVNGLELSFFRKIANHFLAALPQATEPVVYNEHQAAETLRALSRELDQRYDLLKDAGARDIRNYNQKLVSRQLDVNTGHRYLPYMVLIIDEFSGLVNPGNEIEALINRLAQLGRPVGIHLVIATQRPSVKTITGTIKANFASRIAFRVSSQADSRTILDCAGAEQLKGQGDMLFSTGVELVHLQGTFTATAEIEGINDFIGNQRGFATPFLLPIEQPFTTDEFDPQARDSMFEAAARLIIIHQQGSTSLIQRKLKLGYNRAGRIIDQLEAAGIIGAFDGSSAREVLYPDEYSLECHLEALAKGQAYHSAASSPIKEFTIADPVILKSKVVSVEVPTDNRVKEHEIVPVLEPKASFWARLTGRMRRN